MSVLLWWDVRANAKNKKRAEPPGSGSAPECGHLLTRISNANGTSPDHALAGDGRGGTGDCGAADGDAFSGVL